MSQICSELNESSITNSDRAYILYQNLNKNEKMDLNLFDELFNLLKRFTGKFLMSGCERFIDRDDIESVQRRALYRAIKSFKEGYGTKFSTYAVSCMKRAFIDEFRKLKTNLSQVTCSIDEIADLPGGCNVQDIDVQLDYRKFCQRLSGENITLLSLIGMGFETKEVASILGVHVSTVSNRLRNLATRYKKFSRR
ncbi:MAG: sigma factor [Candidatus Heimdallarchaeaceae archaeon]